ncbi:MAG TPA: PQQ-dependent dehydrogenase, methanol/ethanol family [Gemmatimonadaceae bacterium]|nr:PQQ-dependent dehydrogenase, methanol/ethanol family [Gemmatimonadaceae bacterium]
MTLAILVLAGCSRTHQEEAGGEVASTGAEEADRALRAAIQDSAQWPTYGRDYSNRRWSPLAQIDTANVGRLQLAWVHRSGIPHASESGPIVQDGVLYISTALNHVFALDARTGKKKWEYAHQYRTTVDCCAAINRGVAVYGGKVFMGTVDARLVALDARTGRKLWDVQVADPNLGYHITGAPTVLDGMVITGMSGGEQGGRGFVDAYDMDTGAHRWRFYTIPSPAQGGWWGKWREHDEWGQSFHRDVAREKADSAKYADAWQHGGGPMWHHPSYDPALGLLFINVGNPAPDNDGTVRPGDNLYTCSVVALDAETGKLRWYYQEVSHDLWDYDATTPPMLVDVRDSTGKIVKAVAEAGKDGFVYVLDRATGKPIRKSAPFVPLLNYMTPPTPTGVIVNPGTLGGSDWGPPSYSPRTGYMYIDANFLPQRMKQKHEVLRPPAQWWGGGVSPVDTMKSYGLFTAVDLGTGRIAWSERVGKPVISGSVATAGGVVFTGTSDERFIAFDAKTGRQLWSFKTGAAINAPPITYELDGTQYVAVAATGIQTMDTPRGDYLYVFALPNRGTP